MPGDNVDVRTWPIAMGGHVGPFEGNRNARSRPPEKCKKLRVTQLG